MEISVILLIYFQLFHLKFLWKIQCIANTIIVDRLMSISQMNYKNCDSLLSLDWFLSWLFYLFRNIIKT